MIITILGTKKKKGKIWKAPSEKKKPLSYRGLFM